MATTRGESSSGSTVEGAFLAKALFVGGLLYPLWSGLAPEGAVDPFVAWCLVAATMLVPAPLAWFVPKLQPQLPKLCAVSLFVLTGHFFALAMLNQMHPFYAVGSVVMAVNCGLTFSRPIPYLVFSLYVFLLVVTSFAIAPNPWQLTYHGPLCVVLLGSYWNLLRRVRAEEESRSLLAELEHLVDERTAELSRRSDELTSANIQLKREMSERQRAEASLRVWQRLQSVARLAGGFAHDFNNLLTTITVYGAIVRDGLPQNSSQRADADQICSAAERATELTAQLLTFSRDSALQAEVFDLNRLLLESRAMLRAVTRDDVELVLNVAPGSVPICANRYQIEQVLVNLLANARDAMPGGGTVTVETHVLGRDGVETDELPSNASGEPIARLRVSDTGAGMDAETLDQIFDPFFTTKEVGKGTGLGLASVYGTIQQSHGAIRAESEPGKGACFTIDWPCLSEVDLTRIDAAPIAPIRKTAEHRRVLVVDDEPSIRVIARRILEADGFEVEVVADAESALDALRRTDASFDLMLCDVVLPGYNGIDLWREAAAIRPGLRVLFISGHLHHPSLSIRQLPKGTTLLPKPFTSQTLIDEVRSALGAQPLPTLDTPPPLPPPA